MKQVLYWTGAAILLLIGVVLSFAASMESKQLTVQPITTIAFDETQATANLSTAITFPTISTEPGRWDKEALGNMHAWMEEQYADVYADLHVESFGGARLLSWQGSDPNLKPVLFLAHLDVVPAQNTEHTPWTHPPFSGAQRDNAIWGRGAMDCKGIAVSLMEALRALLAHGFTPARTIMVALGHDEEVGGEHGARVIARELQLREVELEFVLDEGLAIIDGIIPGLENPAALIGIAEKGYLTLELSVTGKGGHTSMPPRHTAVGKLATAIGHLEDHPFDAQLGGPTASFFSYLVPHMPWSRRLLFGNRWLFEPLLVKVLAAKPSTDALLRTTTAVTQLQGSPKQNVLPTRATATVNFRILPGESTRSVTERVADLLEAHEVKVAPVPGIHSEPSAVSPVNSWAFTVLAQTIRNVFPDTVVAPGLVLGATDSRHYRELTPHVLRFGPHRFKPGDPARIHGIDERMRKSDFLRGIQFYIQLMRAAASAPN